MKNVAVIANPHAGTGRGRLALDDAVFLLDKAGFSAHALPTERPGHATELARQAALDHDLVVAVGGDGTVHETAKGLAGTACPMGVLPSGSGNDFAMGIGCPTVTLGMKAISAGHIQSFDTGLLNDRFFVNSVGLLASGLVSLRAASLWRWLGRRRYLVASLGTLLKYRGQNVTWEWEGPAGPEKVADRFLLAEICNGTTTGGGFRFTPDALFDDGLLDACLIRPVGLWTALRLLGPASRGEKLEHEAINLVRTGSIRFTCSEAVGYHCDGEPGMLPAGEHLLSLQPGNLKVLTLEGGQSV
jgi:YegS/Rv2252/BmrU family lipid kinase|nr:diacylglycerol kinase family protein [Candidatus Krumholzibacteria bacterium]